jgi:hypothetical protein
MRGALIVAGGALLLTAPTNLAVRFVLSRARGVRIPAEIGAGRWIGVMERLLIYVLFLSGEPAAAGLVVAAKSLLRFPEITGPDSRLSPEYVLVGSLASWLVAFAIAAGALLLI